MVQYSLTVDPAFAALSDPTRRGVLELLRKGDASISDLAARFKMTLTGMKKHVTTLEKAGLVATKKVGRTRQCSLGSASLDEETQWIQEHRQMLEERVESLGAFLESSKGDRT
jgi:DNA-binding transcriptional ArsR family regulator